MKRTPIITVGQVYLHIEHNEYAVVTKSNRGNIFYRGLGGFSGMNEAECFLDRFAPVDPIDLDDNEERQLIELLPEPQALSVGWVHTEDEDGDEDEDGYEG